MTRVGQPDGIYDGKTLFNIKSFIDEYFVLEEGEKVAKDTVMQLARGYFKEQKFSDELMVSKLGNFDVDPPIVYNKNRFHDGMRGVFVNLCLNDKTRPKRKDNTDTSATNVQFFDYGRDYWNVYLIPRFNNSLFNSCYISVSVPLKIKLWHHNHMLPFSITLQPNNVQN